MTPLPQVLLQATSRPTAWKACQFKRDGKWIALDWPEYFDKIARVATHLLELGVKRGDRVAIFSETRLEWALSDLAILSIGAITVPIYANGTAEELQHILNDSGAKILIMDGKNQTKKWEAIQSSIPTVQHILVMDDGNSFAQALKTTPKIDKIQSLAESIEIDDEATLVYTSGTSGLPKGVILTHRQIISEISDVQCVFNVDHRDSTLCFLPFAHVLGRVEMWLSVLAGYTLCYAESIERIKNNLVEVKPTAMIAVPRIFEKIHAGIESQLSQQKFLRAVLDRMDRVNEPCTNWLKGKLLSSKLKAAFGGRLRFAISGGAPLDREIGEFFRAAGIHVYEGYGLTETTAAITVNTPDQHRFGTAGKPLPDVKIKIADDGEILVKSQKVMKGYYKAKDDPFIDGFFPTGDIGHLENGFLVITDRKKDLIKTSGGKYVAPQKLENALKRNPVISNVLVHGDQKKFIVGLITLDEGEIKRWAKSNKINFDSYRDLSQSADVRNYICKVVSTINSELASYESIKKFTILDHDFTVADGELTPSLKVKRKFCDQKYKTKIEELYH
jgi:long-chain acyl-CoA synthetase